MSEADRIWNMLSKLAAAPPDGEKGKTMSDIVEELRGLDVIDGMGVVAQAAAEITRLRAELITAQRALERTVNAIAARGQRDIAEARDRAAAKAEAERLREALASIIGYADTMSADYIGYGGESGHAHTARLARAALQEKPHRKT